MLSYIDGIRTGDPIFHVCISGVLSKIAHW